MSQLSLLPEADKFTHRGAVFSDDGMYRYRYVREWDASLPMVAFLLLNPSKAGVEREDPTSKKVIEFARRFVHNGQRFGRVEIVNPYAYIATDPDDLYAAHKKGVDVVGPMNRAHVTHVLRRAALRVLGWGVNDVSHSPLASEDFLARFGAFHCLGRTKGGEPCHPLMLAYATQLEPYFEKEPQ